MKQVVAIAVICFFVGAQSTLAQQPTTACAEIADPTERLACYDRAYSRQTKSAETAIKSQPGQGQQVEAQQKPSASTVTAPAPAQSTDLAKEADLGGERPKRGLFSWREKVNISSRLISIRDQDKQKMVFRLASNQIWLQDSPRSLPFHEGDNVNIKSATIGGFILTNEKGVSTRVRRIK